MEIIFFDVDSDIVGEGKAQSFADACAQLVAHYQEQGPAVAVWSHPNPPCGNSHCRTALWFMHSDDPNSFDHSCGINPDLHSRKPFLKEARCHACTMAHYEERKQEKGYVSPSFDSTHVGKGGAIVPSRTWGSSPFS